MTLGKGNPHMNAIKTSNNIRTYMDASVYEAIVMIAALIRCLSKLSGISTDVITKVLSEVEYPVNDNDTCKIPDLSFLADGDGNDG